MGRCTHELTEGCLIQGACVSEGARSKLHECAVCNSRKSETKYVIRETEECLAIAEEVLQLLCRAECTDGVCVGGRCVEVELHGGCGGCGAAGNGELTLFSLLGMGWALWRREKTI